MNPRLVDPRVKQRARVLANRALRSGLIKRQPCGDCAIRPLAPVGRRAPRLEMHHEDYGRPLDVAFLCSTHHRWLHLGARARLGLPPIVLPPASATAPEPAGDVETAEVSR